MIGYVFSWETCDFELKPPIIRWEKSMKLVSFEREPVLFMWLLMMAKETKQVGIHGKTDLAWFGHVPRKSGSRNNARDPTWRHVDGSQTFWIFLASFFALASDSPTPPNGRNQHPKCRRSASQRPFAPSWSWILPVDILVLACKGPWGTWHLDLGEKNPLLAWRTEKLVYGWSVNDGDMRYFVVILEGDSPNRQLHILFWGYRRWTMTRRCHICRQEWYQPVLKKLEAGWNMQGPSWTAA